MRLLPAYGKFCAVQFQFQFIVLPVFDIYIYKEKLITF